MQVATVDAVPGSGGTKDSTKPSQAASDAFAILLQNALSQNSNPAQYRGSEVAELVQHFSAETKTDSDALDATPPMADTRRTQPSCRRRRNP